MTRDVPPRDAQGGLGDVGRDSRDLGLLLHDRDGDAPRARPHVAEAPRAALDLLERHGHEVLGLGPRHEHVLRDLEGETVELALPRDVGERLARHAAPESRPEGLELRVGERAVHVEVEVEPLHPERVRQQQLGVETGRVDPLLREPLGGELEDAPGGLRHRGQRAGRNVRKRTLPIARRRAGSASGDAASARGRQASAFDSAETAGSAPAGAMRR